MAALTLSNKMTPEEMGVAIVAHRKAHGINQSKFWNRLGLTQSAGSRFESGRRIKTPLLKLLTLAYGTPAQARKTLDQLRGEQTIPTVEA